METATGVKQLWAKEHQGEATTRSWGPPRWLNGKESTCHAGDAGDADSIPGSGRSPGVGHGNPLLYSCLENPIDRGAWRATVHRVTKSWTRLSSHVCCTESWERQGSNLSRAAKSSQACQLCNFRFQPGELERIHLCCCKSLSVEGFLKADLGKL